jgi:hypothetical protein
MNILYRSITSLGSIITIAFGSWHFFVPRIWDWYAYIPASAPELVAAVRAINFFFSLSLVLFGAVSLILVNHPSANRFTIIVILSALSFLWLARVGLQVIFPQGSLDPVIQYGMLALFIVTTLCFIIPLGKIIYQ